MKVRATTGTGIFAAGFWIWINSIRAPILKQ